MLCVIALTCCVASVLSAGESSDARYFRIQVVDEETGRGVPLVELRTTNSLRYYTDSNGIIAFFEPEFMGREVYFHVKSHGYEYRKDRFGNRGIRLRTTPGESATLKIKRLNIAERLYRVTGAGIYRDSVLVDEPVPIKQPLLNARVTGSDSVVNAVYHGRVYWFWGDTNWPWYPLGNFHVPGATSALPSEGGLDPAAGVDLEYFTRENGFAKETCRMKGDGPTWINGLTVLRDGEGRERMFAAFVKPDKKMKPTRRGICEWDDEAKVFEESAEISLDAPLRPTGHPLMHTEGGIEYVYFATPYPLTRVPATVEAFTDLSEYQGYTCLKDGTRPEEGQIDRDETGAVRYAWRHNTPALTPKAQNQLVKAGHLKPEECLLKLTDVETGKSVNAHGGSVYWNAFRNRWVMIALESFGGESFLGEVWYAEADSLKGPWLNVRKIVTHDRMDFYNPKQDPMFDADGGRTIFFEGTYVNTFSGNPDQTPRYNYNQIMYKLDLASPRLNLPMPTHAQYRPPTDIVFTAEVDGSEQRYVEMLPLGFDATETHDVLIALHGHGSDRWQYVRDNRAECKGARDVAAKHGMIFVSPDYRAKTSWMGATAEADVVQLMDELKSRYNVGKVFLVGGSMGGTAVLTFAALHPDLVDGVSSQNGLADFHGYHVEAAGIHAAIIESFGGTEEEEPDEYRKRSALFHPKSFTMPVAITTGGKDQSVPPDSALKLAEAIKGHNANVLVIHRPQTGHTTSYEDTVAALEFVLERAK